MATNLTRTQARSKAEGLSVFRKTLHPGQSPGPHAYALLLGLKVVDAPGLLRSVQAGLAYKALERFQRNMDLTTAELCELLQIPARTLVRRKDQGRLQPDESDRLLRISRLFGKALELFEGDLGAAKTWLSAAQTALGDSTPLELAKTELGGRELENLMGRLEQGVFS